MADVPKKAEDLTPEQRDRLFRHLRAGRTAPRPGIPVRPDRDAPAPLSYAQQRLWFLDQLQPGTPFYNIPVAVRIEGALDVSSLRGALAELVRRHETLRTTFEVRDGQPLQVIAPQGEPMLRLVDLGALTAEQAESLIHSIYRQEAREGFDLQKGPLLRTTLVRNSPESHALLVVFHHIVSDLWSFGVFIRELMQLYSALRRGAAASLPALPIQYADFAVWQRQRLQGELLQQEVEHWKQVLAGVSVQLELPGDRARPPVMAFQGARVDWKLPAHLSSGLKDLGQNEEATQFMTLLAAYGLLLARYSGQQDLVIGSPVANRSRIELEGLIGFFINMLVLRVDLTRQPSFRELLGRVKERCIQAFNHQDLPFEQLVDDLGIERDLSRPPLIQAALAVQNVALPFLQMEGLSFASLKTKVGTSKFDLTMEIFDQESGLQGSTEYNSELFEEVTARRISHHFAVLLESLIAEPERSVWELPLLSAAERQQLLQEWRPQPEPRPQPELRGETLTGLFEAVAHRQPGAPAMLWDGGELRYEELAARSLQVAARLRGLKVGPEALVGLLFDPSPELLVAVLGVLRAGGACLLLDTGGERSWLEKSLEQSGVSVVLTQERLIRRLPEHGAQEALLERLEEPGDPQDRPGDAAPEALAFVVQTSGSHHAPRFVGLEHRAVTAWVRHWEERLSAEELARVAAPRTLGTVDAAFGLVLPLCLGGSLVLTEHPVETSLASATPAQLSMQLRRGSSQNQAPAVRSFGQPLSRSLAETLRGLGVRLYDSYSSARGGVWEWESGRVPSVAAYVLDQAGEPVPIGVRGELWLSGEGLARGYATDAGQTAELFAPDPFGGRPGGRRVRTGDLARWRGDGSLQLLGEIERQVELRDST